MNPFDEGLRLVGKRPMPKDINRQINNIQQNIDDPLEYYEFKKLYAPILLHLVKLTTTSCKRTN